MFQFSDERLKILREIRRRFGIKASGSEKESTQSDKIPAKIGKVKSVKNKAQISTDERKSSIVIVEPGTPESVMSLEEELSYLGEPSELSESTTLNIKSTALNESMALEEASSLNQAMPLDEEKKSSEGDQQVNFYF